MNSWHEIQMKILFTTAQKPIQDVKIHFQDRGGTGSLHNRNRAEITDGSCVWKKALSDMVLSSVVKT